MVSDPVLEVIEDGVLDVVVTVDRGVMVELLWVVVVRED